jgi:hypothetical protein
MTFSSTETWLLPAHPASNAAIAASFIPPGAPPPSERNLMGVFL